MKRVNFFIVVILFLLGFSILYFLYFRARNQAEVYVGVSVGRSTTATVNTPFNWVPYWIENAISVGDKEVSPLGGVNAEVLEKNSYEAAYYGQFVFLLLRMNAIRDRSGMYLFKNKPLSAGAVIDLNLTKAQIQGLVTYIGTEKANYQLKKLKVTLYGKAVEGWIAESIKVGSQITDNNKQTIAKVLDKKVSAATSSLINIDNTQRGLQMTIELSVKKIDGTYFYAETQKVKVDEMLFLPFKEVSLNLPVTSVSEISETK